MKKPIDNSRFMSLVKSNQGIKRIACIDTLGVGGRRNKTSDKSRMDRAQIRALEDGWLVIQKESQIVRYYTVEYAKEHNIAQSVKVTPKRPKNKSEQSPERKEIVSRCRLIDSLWINRGLLS